MNEIKVDAVIVNRLIKSLELGPNKICLRFQTRNGVPTIKLILTHISGIRETLVTPANSSLIEAVLDAMKIQFDTIKHFKASGDMTVPDRSDDFELEMFKQFVGLSYPMEIKEDYITDKGDRFSQVVFTTLNPQAIIYFCVKQTEEVENLLYNKKAE